MRISIIGAGAIGCLFGSLLAKSGNQVTLVHRRRSVVQKMRQYGVILHQTNGKKYKIHLSASLSPANLSNSELVIFAVKAFQTGEAANQHSDKLGRDSIVLTLQNGLGNIEILSKLLGRNPVLGGATTEASLPVGNGEVVHTGKGTTWIGELDRTVSTRVKRIAQTFRLAGLNTRFSSNINGIIWTKAIVNSAINPLSALTRLPNGMLLRSKELSDSMSRIVDEGVSVSKAEGVTLAPRTPRTLLLRVLKATASNESSMLQDLARSRKTEVRQLNGAIVRVGRRHNISTPLNSLLVSLVKALESSENSQDH